MCNKMSNPCTWVNALALALALTLILSGCGGGGGGGGRKGSAAEFAPDGTWLVVGSDPAAQQVRFAEWVISETTHGLEISTESDSWTMTASGSGFEFRSPDDGPDDPAILRFSFLAQNLGRGVGSGDLDGPAAGMEGELHLIRKTLPDQSVAGPCAILLTDAWSLPAGTAIQWESPLCEMIQTGDYAEIDPLDGWSPFRGRACGSWYVLMRIVPDDPGYRTESLCFELAPDGRGVGEFHWRWQDALEEDTGGADLAFTAIVGPDHADSALEGTAIEAPSANPGVLEHPGDIDWFLLPVTEGSAVILRTVLGTLHDSRLAVCTANGQTQLGENDDDPVSGGFASRIDFVPPYTGLVAVKVWGYSSEQLGSYLLLIEESAGDAGPGGVLSASVDGCSGWSFEVSGESFESTTTMSHFGYDSLGRVTHDWGTVSTNGRTYHYDARLSWNSLGCIRSLTLTVSGGLLGPEAQTVSAQQ